MIKKNFYLLIDDICESPPGTIIGTESLKDGALFSSLAMLGLIAMLDKNFNIHLNTDDLREIDTVNNLFIKISACKI